jgi:hypothetical protein
VTHGLRSGGMRGRQRPAADHIRKGSRRGTRWMAKATLRGRWAENEPLQDLLGRGSRAGSARGRGGEGRGLATWGLRVDWLGGELPAPPTGGVGEGALRLSLMFQCYDIEGRSFVYEELSWRTSCMSVAQCLYFRCLNLFYAESTI